MTALFDLAPLLVGIVEEPFTTDVGCSVCLCHRVVGVVFLFVIGAVALIYHLCCVALRCLGGLVVDLCGVWPWNRRVASCFIDFSQFLLNWLLLFLYQ
jgi:hypothetical protein